MGTTGITPYFSISAKEALAKLNTSSEGLSDFDVEKRQIEFGLNKLPERKKKTVFKMFLEEFKDFVVQLLIAAALIAGTVSYLTNEHDYLDTIAILSIVIINAMIGVYQEYKAGEAIDALKKMVQAKAKVIRNGKELEINTADLVPGDIIVLNEGDKVPADARLITTHNLEVDEASLTGESIPVSKNADEILPKDSVINDQENMVFMSTLVTKGTSRAVVAFTGEKTQIGKIAEMVQDIEDETTPLQNKLEILGKQLGKLAIGATIAVFTIGILRSYLVNELTLDSGISLFLISVSLAVAIIPEGLPAVVTIALAIGVQRMVAQNSIIRRLSAAESLGSATVICSDKTGTLTKNEMTVRQLYTNNKDYSVTGMGYGYAGEYLDETGKGILNPLREQNFELLMHCAILCNNSAVVEKGQNNEIIGDPTEGCLLVAAKKANMDYLMEKKKREKVEELTFDSTRKMMTTIYDENEAGFYAYSKGAPENVLEKCSHILINGKPQKLDPVERQKLTAIYSKYASVGLRVLGFAYRQLKNRQNRKLTIEEVENELIFIGFMAMMDPPREEVKNSIAQCKQAGIRVIMITGDNELTAKVIASELGIFDEKKDRVMTGRELEKIDPERFEKIVLDIAVYARVSPEHKLKIVTALQKRGELVAMTGDGVNDAPAIKKAEIGIAMGITGTDVAKESADMVITDDNFASIVSAVEEGRIIFDNIMKAVYYLFSCNIAEVLVIFITILAGFPIPLVPIQILWMNLTTDALPALALAADGKSKDIMKRRPRDPKSEPLPKSEISKLAFIGILITIVVLGLYYWFVTGLEFEKARTIVFNVIVFSQLFIALSWHAGSDTLLRKGIFTNKFLIAAIIATILTQLLIVQSGFFNQIFKTIALSAVDWLICIIASIGILIVVEFSKYLRKNPSAEIAIS